MSRGTVAHLALGLLLLLTLATWRAEGAVVLAVVAALKIAVIGAVFLELDRAWPGWALLSGVVVAAVLGGAVAGLG